MAGVEKLIINTLPTLNLSSIDDKKLLSPDTPSDLKKSTTTSSKEAESESPLSPNDLEKCLDETKPHDFPEGGLKAYMTVLGAFMVFACTFGRMSAFGTFQAWYASHQLQHLPESTISWIGSIQYCIFFFSVRFNFLILLTQLILYDSNNYQGATIGRLFDAYGPTRLMIAGTLCGLISTLTTSVCKEYYQFILSQGVLFGLGVGLLYVEPRIFAGGPILILLLLFLDFIHPFQAFRPISQNIALQHLALP